VSIEFGQSRATYLPQVWAQLPDPHDFIARLKQKAGLPEDFWSDDIKLSHYTVQKWQEIQSNG
jgi:AMMECR1 domain-containing protein